MMAQWNRNSRKINSTITFSVYSGGGIVLTVTSTPTKSLSPSSDEAGYNDIG